MRKFYFLLLLMSLSFAGWSQNKGLVKGTLADSASHQPLALATLTVFKAADTSIITYRLSDPEGNFKLPNLPLNVPARLLVSFSGYGVVRREFMLTDDKPELSLDTLLMQTDTVSLDEVLVVAERPPVTVKEGMIEFNATSFKTLPNALLEDLLKKLPGVDVDEDGNIRVNGRKVNKILVDGKEFFGDDPKIASRNLPANIIDKVQVVDDLDQLDRDPNTLKGDLGQVINLKLKRDIKQGWFGKAYAGGGTDDRYEAGGIINMFRDTFQISVLGYTNNLNKAGFGFSDIQNLGGFSRSGFNSISIWSDGGFAVNGISFGATGQGIQHSTGAGFNANNQLGKNVTLNLQYFYGEINSTLERQTHAEQFINDTVLTSITNLIQQSHSYNHRIGGSVRWKVDSMSQIMYRPSITLQQSPYTSSQYSTTSDNKRGPLNTSDVQEDNRQRTNGYDHELSYRRNFKRKGTSFYIANNITTSSGHTDLYNNSENVFYTSGSPENSSFDQLRQTNAPSFNTRFYTYYNGMFTDKLGYQVKQSFTYFKDENILNTFTRDDNSGKYDVATDSLSNGLTRSGNKTISSLQLNWKPGKWTISPGINAQWLNIDNDFVKNSSIGQHFSYITPSLDIRWKELNFNYGVNIDEPRADYLQPVTNNTNPLYQTLGNISLKPTVNHNFGLNYNKYDMKTKSSYFVYLNGHAAKDGVIMERRVNEDGVQITQPINVDGMWGASLSANVSRQFKVSTKWQLTLRGRVSGSMDRTKLLVNGAEGSQRSIGLSPSLGWSFNWNDKVEFNQTYRLGYSDNTYDNSTFTDLEVTNHYAETELVLRMPRKFVWESSLTYRYNPQVAQGIRKDNYLLNAGLTYLFLKEDKGQLKLSVYDLLDQNIGVYRSVSENYVRDVQTTVLKRYFLLTFTYNIRDFKGAKVGGKDRLFIF